MLIIRCVFMIFYGQIQEKFWHKYCLSKANENKIKDIKMTTYKDARFSSIKSYMKEIRKIPILTRAEEVKLFKQFYQGSTDAKEKLIRANLRFVVSVAKKYRIPGISLMDLINEGNIGLIKAIHKFDVRKKVTFISYGVWWIRQAILKAISEQSRAIRVPANISNNIVKVNKHTNRLSQMLGRTPTVHELSQDTDLDEKEVKACIHYSKSTASLEKKIDNGSGEEAIYFIKDDEKNEPHYYAEKYSLVDEINYVLDTLSKKEKVVLNYRFGLNNHEKESLEKIAKRLGVSKERIRQIEEKALTHLKTPSRRERLQVYIQEN